MGGTQSQCVVALTGASGLIGHATFHALQCAGVSVRGHAGPEGLSPKGPGPSLAEAPGPGFVWGDITDAGVLQAALDGATAVIHLAGPSSVSASFADPAGTVAAHAAGTASVMQAAARSGTVHRVVVASSAEVYGIPRTARVAEDHPLDPLSPYAAGKLGAEAVARCLAHPLGLELVLLRPFAVYGSRSPAWSILASTVRRALSGGPVTMTSLERVRDFVHVGDVAAAFAAAATAPSAEQVRTFNVCTGIGTRIQDLVTSVLTAVGSQAAILEAEAGTPPGPLEVLEGRRPPESDPMRLVGDPTLASSELGWTARTSLHDGLAAIVNELGRQRA